jgi:hypothetical protein
MDNEFKKVRPMVPGLNINTTAAKEHVPEIERRIQVIKERGRALLNTLPYIKMPRLILIELIYHIVLWLDAFPSKSGVSETLLEIVLRHRLDFAKHCRAPFGSYCEAHGEPAPTNTMVSLAMPSIVLWPTGNLQEIYKFFSLITGKKIKRRQFTRYPVPDSVITKVERFARTGIALGLSTLPFAAASSSSGTRRSMSHQATSWKRITSCTRRSQPSSQEWTSRATRLGPRSRTPLSPTGALKTRPPSTQASWNAL